MPECTPVIRTLRNRVEARLSHLDLDGYDFDWLDSRDAAEIKRQLRWLDYAAAERRVEGDDQSADDWDEVLEVIQIETQLSRFRQL